MSGKIVNLGRARKFRARAERRAKADENAARHGRSKAEREAEAARAEARKRHLDGHRRYGPGDCDGREPPSDA